MDISHMVPIRNSGSTSRAAGRQAHPAFHTASDFVEALVDSAPANLTRRLCAARKHGVEAFSDLIERLRIAFLAVERG